MMEKIRERVEGCVHSPRAALMVLALVTAAVFITILPNEFLMEDLEAVFHRPLVQDLGNVPRFFSAPVPPEGQIGGYAPLKTLGLALVFALFRDQVWGWHLVSILIHFFGVMAVYALTQRMLGDRRISFLSALVFAVHPALTDAVAPVSGSVGTAGLVLALWSFYYYLRAVPLAAGEAPVFNPDGSLCAAPGQNPGIADARALNRSVLFAVPAIFLHEGALFLPLMIVLYHVLFSRRRITLQGMVRCWGPYLAVAAVYLVSRGLVSGPWEGGYGPDSFSLKMMAAITAWGQYAAVLVAPLILSRGQLLFSGHPAVIDLHDPERVVFLSRSWQDPAVALSALLLGVLVFSAVVFYRRRTLLSFCALWFYVTLLPVSGLLPGPVYYAERFLYAGAWVYGMAAAWVLVVLERKVFSRGSVRRTVFFVCAAVMIGFYGIRAVVRNRDYRNDAVFYERALRAEPRNVSLKHDLALVYAEEKRFDEVERILVELIESRPDNPQFHFSLAVLYMAMGRQETAWLGFERCVELDPDFAEAFFNMAVILVGMNQEAQGLEYLERARQAWQNQGLLVEAAEAVNAFHGFRLMSRDSFGEEGAAALLGEQN